MVGSLLLNALMSNGQLTTIPASAPCGCDGGLTYSPEPGSATFFSLIDLQGNNIANLGAANGILNLANLCEGIYFIEANTAANTYSQYLQIANAIAPMPAITETDICSTSPNTNFNTFIAGLPAGGIWTMPNGIIFNGVYNPSTLSSGFYTYTLDNAGCTQTTGVLVNEIQNANAGIQTTYLICDSYSAFNMFDFLEGNPDTGGQWLTSGGTPMNGIYDPATMSSSLFVYAIDNVPGCNTVFTTMFIDERTTPSAGTNSSLIVCNGASAFNLFNHIPGNPNPEGFWFRPNGTAFNGIFNPNTDPSGNYRYVVTANAPCQDAESIITISFSNTDPSGTSNQLDVCTSQPAFDMLSALGGSPIAGGIWTNTNGQIINGTFNPAINNSGVFSYYFPNVGCNTQGAQLTITEFNSPNAGQDIITELCTSLTPVDLFTLLINENPGGVFQNNNGDAISNILSISNTQLFQAEYIVSPAVCPADTASIIIGVVAPPNDPSNLTYEICANSGLLNLNDLYQDVVFPQWFDTNGAQVPAQFDPFSGSATLTIVSQSQNVCPDENANLEIVVVQPAFSDQSFVEVLCTTEFPIDLNDYLSNTIISLGEWYDTNNLLIQNTIINLVAGNYSYQYFSVNNGPCAASEVNVELQVFEAAEAGDGSNIVVCESEPNFSLENLLSSNAQIGGAWYNAGVPIIPQNYNLVGNVTDVLTYEVSGNLGCAPDAAQFIIDVHAQVTAQAGDDVSLCFGENNVQIGSPPIPNLNYSWVPSSLLSNAQVANPVITLNGLSNENQEVVFTLSVSDGVCEATDEVVVTILEIPTVSINALTEICLGEEVNYTVDPSLSCSWSPANLFVNTSENNPTIAPFTSTNVNVEVENDNGCTATSSGEIIVRPLPVLDFEMTPSANCAPMMVEDTWNNAVGLDYSIQWNGGNGDDESGIDYLFNYTTPGSYNIELRVANEFGCISDTIYENAVVVYPNPVAQFSYSPDPPSIINNVVQFQNESESVASYEWYIDDVRAGSEETLNYEFPSDRSGDYTVCLRVENEFGCEAAHCEYLEIESDFAFYAPNAFTPDGDGLNELFIPELLGFDLSSYSLKIYDRWGTLVFSTNDASEPWIGNVRNGDYYAQQGIYNWIVEVKVDRLADFKTFKGSVLLLR
jgi:gliding motility-associated-like protein